MISVHLRPAASQLPAFASSSFAASRESPDASARQACSRIGPNLPMRTQDKLAPASVHSRPVVCGLKLKYFFV